MADGIQLADSLKEQLRRTGLTVDGLADRTKVPRPTIRALMGESVSAILPERVYLRGQTAILARELGMDTEQVLRAFDAQYPTEPDESAPDRGWGARTTIVGAGLGCVALAAVVLAFASL